MLARIAQELYWLGRDLARGEHTARMLDGAFHADVAGAGGTRGMALTWEGVLATIGAKPPVPGEVEDRRSAAGPAGDGAPAELRSQVTSLLMLDPSSPASIVACVTRARNRGRRLRDVISGEMWQALNAFYLWLYRHETSTTVQSRPYSVYHEVKERCALFWGLVSGTMLRDEARAFLEAGGRIEEADMMLRMLRVAVPDGSAGDRDGELEALALLHAVGGVEAYRRATPSRPAIDTVVPFLLFDGNYPASVASAVDALRHALMAADAQPRFSPPVLRLDRLVADLELQRRSPEGDGDLHPTLAAVAAELELVDREIDARFFAAALPLAVHL